MSPWQAVFEAYVTVAGVFGGYYALCGFKFFMKKEAPNILKELGEETYSIWFVLMVIALSMIAGLFAGVIWPYQLCNRQSLIYK